MSKRAAVQCEMVAQMAQRAAEDRLKQYQDLESKKWKLLAEADLRLPQICEEVAAFEKKHRDNEGELMIEHAATLKRLKQEAIEEYRKLHNEVRQTQEEQLRKKLEKVQQKILEESAARKEALEKEQEATIEKLKEEAQKKY
ncbi:hypothetical protein PPACK8108_LOCUS24076 [Phakopsora pachyrhizi]|uniref:Uncharacterized protein n=1 Tax=Phakopsora pachyrhizi TaxID=170000 RepID=A0AAV0BRL8_PHAPC|nr:hypothetical protein PPACK8108_LOCUS24076 [Phakopsora pachyrhizi]